MKRASVILIAVAVLIVVASVVEAAPCHRRRRVRVHYHLGGRGYVTTDGIHPAAVRINGIPYFPYPGDGGTWIEYRNRQCYAYAGLLYVQVKKDSIRLRFRRLPLPSELRPKAPVEAVATTK